MAKKDAATILREAKAAGQTTVSVDEMAKQLGLKPEQIAPIPPSSLRSADSIPDSEKIASYNRLHRFAMEGLESLMKDGRYPKDYDHYAFEEVMQAMLGNNIFTTLNALETNGR